MKGFEFYVGCNDGQDKARKYDPAGVMRFVTKMLCMGGIVGASMSTVTGMWKGELETTVKVMVAIDDHQKSALEKAVQACKEAFNQEAVMVVEKADSFLFV